MKSLLPTTNLTHEGIEVVSVDWGEETYDDATGKIGLTPYGEDYRFENSGDRYYVRARLRIQDGYQLGYEDYGALADTDAALAQSYGELILVKQGGTINVYFNVESKTVRIEMQS